ncbi:MAG: metallophosphoesterase, partial [Acidimicrobiia bacterium]
MKVLHTSDWHVGKRLGRYDRSDEYRSVINEVVTIADDEAVDLVLHSGDLFD